MFVGGRLFILYYIYNILHTNTVNCTQNISSRSFRILFNMHENAAKRSLVCVWWKSYGSEIRRENPVDMENLPFFTTGFITSSGGWECFLFLSLDGTFWHLNVLLMKVWINVGHFFRKLMKFLTILKKNTWGCWTKRGGWSLTCSETKPRHKKKQKNIKSEMCASPCVAARSSNAFTSSGLQATYERYIDRVWDVSADESQFASVFSFCPAASVRLPKSSGRIFEGHFPPKTRPNIQPKQPGHQSYVPGQPYQPLKSTTTGNISCHLPKPFWQSAILEHQVLRVFRTKREYLVVLVVLN